MQKGFVEAHWGSFCLSQFVRSRLSGVHRGSQCFQLQEPQELQQSEVRCAFFTKWCLARIIFPCFPLGFRQFAAFGDNVVGDITPLYKVALNLNDLQHL